MGNEKLKQIANERIGYLFNLISESDDFDYGAIRSIEKIRLKYNIRLNTKQKEIYCKSCLSKYINPKIRFRKINKNKTKWIQKIIICNICRKERRFRVQ